jgi:hypothetical protein
MLPFQSVINKINMIITREIIENGDEITITVIEDGISEE